MSAILIPEAPSHIDDGIVYTHSYSSTFHSNAVSPILSRHHGCTVMLLSTRHLPCTSETSLTFAPDICKLIQKSDIPAFNFSLAEMHLEGEEDGAAETVEETAGTAGTVVVTTVMGVMVEAAMEVMEAVMVEDGVEAATEVVMEAVMEAMGEAVMEEAVMEAGAATEEEVVAIKGQAESDEHTKQQHPTMHSVMTSTTLMRSNVLTCTHRLQKNNQGINCSAT